MFTNLKTGILLMGFLVFNTSLVHAQVISGDTTKTDTLPKVSKKNILQRTSSAASSTSNSNEDKKFSPNFSPLSPNAAGVQKFQDFQVNLATGSPDISIPIYSAKSGSLSLPIVLRFGGANGHTLTDLASWVGWGWSLDLGISLNRSIRSAADDIPASSSYLNTNSGFDWDLCANVNDFTNAQIANTGFYDLEPDLFTYNIGSASGKFYLKKQTLEPFLMPFQPIKITSDFTSTTRIDKWTVTSAEGQKYVFGKDKNGAIIQDFQTTDGVSSGLGSSGAISWHLAEIQSPNSDDKIEVEYYPEETPQKIIKLLSLQTK